VIKTFFITALITTALSGCSSINMPLDPHSKLEGAEKAQKCQELRQEIDALKGKPMQRGAHLEYYEDLCFDSF